MQSVYTYEGMLSLTTQTMSSRTSLYIYGSVLSLLSLWYQTHWTSKMKVIADGVGTETGLVAGFRLDGQSKNKAVARTHAHTLDLSLHKMRKKVEECAVI